MPSPSRSYVLKIFEEYSANFFRDWIFSFSAPSIGGEVSNRIVIYIYLCNRIRYSVLACPLVLLFKTQFSVSILGQSLSVISLLYVASISSCISVTCKHNMQDAIQSQHYILKSAQYDPSSLVTLAGTAPPLSENNVMVPPPIPLL